MKELIERLEKATGPDREIDSEIGLAMGLERHDEHWWKINGVWELSCPKYTSSIDAALTLVPEGFYWSTDSRGATIVGSEYPGNGEPDVCSIVHHKLPAIALCRAALHVRDFLANRPTPSPAVSEKVK